MTKPFLVGVSQFTLKDSTQAGWKQKVSFKELDPRVCIIKWQGTKSGKRRRARENEKRSLKPEEKPENHEERTRNIGNTEGTREQAQKHRRRVDEDGPTNKM